jgi:hypothetical protein
MASNRRRRFLIDAAVQLGLLRRLALYAVYCIITAVMLVFFWRLLAEGEARPHQHLIAAIVDIAPLLLALMAILPFVAWDLLKLTNRFAGPVYRVRVTLECLARGETIRPVKFRDGDFWVDLAPLLNLVALELGQLQESQTPAPAEEDRSDATDGLQELVRG